MADPLKLIPDDFVQGDTLAFLIAPQETPIGSWPLTFTMDNGQDVIKATATESDGSYLVTITNVLQAKKSAGLYHYQGYIENAGERYTLVRGKIEMLPNVIDGGTLDDQKSHAEKMLALFEAALQGDPDVVAQNMSLGGRSYSKWSPEQLRKERDYYAGVVKREKRAAKGQAPRKILVRHKAAV